jgi:hypothetical protein
MRAREGRVSAASSLLRAADPVASCPRPLLKPCVHPPRQPNLCMCCSKPAPHVKPRDACAPKTAHGQATPDKTRRHLLPSDKASLEQPARPCLVMRARLFFLSAAMSDMDRSTAQRASACVSSSRERGQQLLLAHMATVDFTRPAAALAPACTCLSARATTEPRRCRKKTKVEPQALGGEQGWHKGTQGQGEEGRRAAPARLLSKSSRSTIRKLRTCRPLAPVSSQDPER